MRAVGGLGKALGEAVLVDEDAVAHVDKDVGQVRRAAISVRSAEGQTWKSILSPPRYSARTRSQPSAQRTSRSRTAASDGRSSTTTL